jgi:lipoate-protein ligase A
LSQGRPDTGWDIRVRPGFANAADQLALEQSLLAEPGAAERPPLASIWESEPALVVSQSDRHLPRFADAVRQVENDGWPVSVRSTGGSAVPLAPGVVNVGLIASWNGDRPTLDTGFRLLCGPLIAALHSLGITTGTGRAPRAFCDGRWNILVGVRKIAGTSQRQASREKRGAVLLHAAVMIDADPVALTNVVARFYEAAGDPRELDADAVTSLAQVLAAPIAVDPRAAFIAALSSVLASPETVPAWCGRQSSPSSPAATSADP